MEHHSEAALTGKWVGVEKVKYLSRTQSNGVQYNATLISSTEAGMRLFMTPCMFTKIKYLCKVADQDRGRSRQNGDKFDFGAVNIRGFYTSKYEVQTRHS